MQKAVIWIKKHLASKNRISSDNVSDFHDCVRSI